MPAPSPVYNARRGTRPPICTPTEAHQCCGNVACMRFATFPDEVCGGKTLCETFQNGTEWPLQHKNWTDDDCRVTKYLRAWTLAGDFNFTPLDFVHKCDLCCDLSLGNLETPTYLRFAVILFGSFSFLRLVLLPTEHTRPVIIFWACC